VYLNCFVAASSFSLGDNIVGQKELEQICEKTFESEKHLENQTGIKSRRYVNNEKSTSDLASECIERMFQKFDRKKVRYLIVATTSPDCPSPATAHFLHQKLNLNPDVLCFDVASSCTSFLSALMASSGLVSSLKEDEFVLLVAAEVKSKSLGKDVRMRSLFSDGACAMLIKNGAQNINFGFHFCYNKTRSEFVENICIPVGGSKVPATVKNIENFHLRMTEPKMLFRETVKEILHGILSCWDHRCKLGFDEKTPGLILVHQANANILKEVRDRLPENLKSRMPILMNDIGNTVCASLPILRARMGCFEFLNAAQRNETLWPAFASGSEASTSEHFFLPQFQSDLLAADIDEADRINVAARGSNLQNVRSDIWVAAGGGFQTVGCVHVFPI
jgi:3-oxoacyl-[acyl-carrier-protein] synthase III